MIRYLIILDIDANHLVENFHKNIDEAYVCIRRILENHDFRNIQGSVYMGEEGIAKRMQPL